MKITLNNLVFLALLVVMISSGCATTGWNYRVKPGGVVAGGLIYENGTREPGYVDYNAPYAVTTINVTVDEGENATLVYAGYTYCTNMPHNSTYVLVVRQVRSLAFMSLNSNIRNNLTNFNRGKYFVKGIVTIDGDKIPYSKDIRVGNGGAGRSNTYDVYISDSIKKKKRSRNSHSFVVNKNHHNSGQSVRYNEPYYRKQGVFGPWEEKIAEAFKDYNPDGSKRQ